MKFRAFVIFVIFLGILPDICLLLVSASEAPLAFKAALCLPTLVTLVCLPLIGFGIRYTASVRVFSWTTFIFEFPKTWAAIFSALPPRWAALVGITVSLIFIYLIFFFSRHLVVKRQEVSFPSLPEGLDGLRICHLSDLHVGSFGKAPRYIRRIVDKVLSEKPDIILFSGDLVNFSTSEVEPFRDELLRLEAPMGVFAVRGNHDYLLHGHHSEADRLSDIEKLFAFEEGLGWTVLRNQNVILRRNDTPLAIIGVENVSANPFFKDTGGDLSKAVEGLPKDVFSILMSHDPSHWRNEILPHSDIPLTLSGHTHGLPYKFAGFHPSHWRLHESGGLYREGERVLHVSEGLGSAFAFRIGGFPKIDILILKR